MPKVEFPVLWMPRQRRVVPMIDLHKTNKRSSDELDEDDADTDLDDSRKQRKHGNPPHQLQLHGPVSPESPGPMADDVATEPDVEVLDSPADADEFHDAIEQMDRQIDQLEQPPDSPFSYAPTTPAETVVADNDEPNNNNNDATDVAIPQNDMPADEDLPPVPSDDSEVEDGSPVAVNTLPASVGDVPAAAVNTLPADSGNDGFRQRRRRMDQGEMAWLRNFQSQRRSLDELKDESEQKRQRIFNSVEVGFYSSNGEHNKFAHDMLPDGWT